MTSDQETEQLLYEIEQLAARALADTGHGLQPNRQYGGSSRLLG